MNCFDLFYAMVFGDEREVGSHKHHCEDCGFVWEHADTNAGNDEAHTCVCGREVWSRYYGPLKAMFVGCGRPMKVVKEVVNKTTKKVVNKVKAICKRKTVHA